MTNFILKLVTKYAILEAELEGHKMVAKVEKQRRNRGKALFKAEDIDGKAQFFTPGRITIRRVEIQAQKEAEDDELVRKAEEKRIKKQYKEEQAILVAQRKTERAAKAQAKKH